MPLGDLGRILAYLREAEALAAALDDPRRLAQVSLLLSVPYFASWASMISAMAAGPARPGARQAGGDVVLQALANLAWA